MIKKAVTEDYFYSDFGVNSEPSSLDIDLLNYDSGIEAEIEENKGA
jgi:hypothetical protein